MANEKDQPIVDITQTISKTEKYFEENKRSILIIVGSIVGIILIVFSYYKFYIDPLEQEAQQNMFWAERYFEKDSIKQALNGDGIHPGFIDLASDYSGTPSGNLCNYYMGICYLNSGKYEEAIEALEDFSAGDNMLGVVATAGIGEAYMELEQTEDAVDYYIKAANMYKNEFSTPVYLMKAGSAYESMNNFEEALKVYEQVKADYPETREGKEIDKYIAYAKAKAGI